MSNPNQSDSSSENQEQTGEIVEITVDQEVVVEETGEPKVSIEDKMQDEQSEQSEEAEPAETTEEPISEETTEESGSDEPATEAKPEDDLNQVAEVIEAVPDKPKGKKEESKEPEIQPIENPAQGRAALECILFLAIEPITLKKLCKHLPPLKEQEIRALITELQTEYDSRASGLQILEIGGGFQMATRSDFSPWVLSMQKIRKRPTLSPAALETLAIIAYKQPITRAEIESIRGVDSSSLVRMLQEIEFVTILGHKEVVGRPQLFGTTNKFLKAYGLASLNDLPSISELKQQFGANED